MVEEVVRHVVACVSEDASTVGRQGRIPVPKDNSMSKLPERRCQNDKKGGRHNKSVFVHWQVVVNTVQEEVESDADTVVGKVAALRQ